MQTEPIAAQDATALPKGISIGAEWGSAINYMGAEKAFLESGFIQPEWLEGLGRYVREIALDPERGFVIVGEGKGNRITYAHREHGAFKIKRLGDGMMSVVKYRTLLEERAIEEAQRKEYRQQREQQQKQQQEVQRGLIEAPGTVALKLTPTRTAACFDVGDHVLYFRDGAGRGVEVVIRAGFDLYQVLDDEGPYIDADDRVGYQYGYITSLRGETDTFFVPAHCLTRDDCKPSHLVLVHSRQNHSSGLAGACHEQAR